MPKKIMILFLASMKIKRLRLKRSNSPIKLPMKTRIKMEPNKLILEIKSRKMTTILASRVAKMFSPLEKGSVKMI